MVLQFLERFSQYSVDYGMHCGGESIREWNVDKFVSKFSNNERVNPTEYGTVKGISHCKAVCNMHLECNGFVHRTTDDICGFWKKGPFRLSSYQNHNCYRKGLNTETL